MQGTIVTVCDAAGSKCNDCGTALVTLPGQWATIFCRPNAVGSIVKVVTPNSYLQACEIEIFGTSKFEKMKPEHSEMCSSLDFFNEEAF